MAAAAPRRRTFCTVSLSKTGDKAIDTRCQGRYCRAVAKDARDSGWAHGERAYADAPAKRRLRRGLAS